MKLNIYICIYNKYHSLFQFRSELSSPGMFAEKAKDSKPMNFYLLFNIVFRIFFLFDLFYFSFFVLFFNLNSESFHYREELFDILIQTWLFKKKFYSFLTTQNSLWRVFFIAYKFRIYNTLVSKDRSCSRVKQFNLRPGLLSFLKNKNNHVW